MNREMKKVLIALMVLVVQGTTAQETLSKQGLHEEIMKMDSLLFQEAFNKCNLALYQTIVTEDIEFYDDRSGLNTSLETEINSFKDKCSKTFSVTRELTHSSVHVLGDFGAMQQGTHVFLVDGKKVQKAAFISIWERKTQGWIMKRAVSFDHQDL